jgi:GNAT superfamily N-acetyltransferase
VAELPKRASSAPEIRPATDADVLPMAKVHIVSWRETYPGMLPHPMLERLSIADEAIRWQRTLDRPRAWGGLITFVADQDGSIVGYGSCGEQRTVTLRERGFTGEIGELYVLRRAQRQGAGSGLMKAMAGALRERGHRALSLWVLEPNSAARRFYESLGGTPIAEKRASLIEVAYGWSDLGPLLSSRAY